ncbi:hypothetical protein D770_25995 [Flammeovirgaceae bacterium 311]|nr:hypothetical protein D770_25995 [Flammeovirgaceae bacterium 311]
MIREGTKVTWKWGSGTAEGKVQETFDHEVTRTIKGSEITRKGEAGNKALLIRQNDGAEVLKLESEVSRA